MPVSRCPARRSAYEPPTQGAVPQGKRWRSPRRMKTIKEQPRAEVIDDSALPTRSWSSWALLVRPNDLVNRRPAARAQPRMRDVRVERHVRHCRDPTLTVSY